MVTKGKKLQPSAKTIAEKLEHAIHEHAKEMAICNSDRNLGKVNKALSTLDGAISDAEKSSILEKARTDGFQIEFDKAVTHLINEIVRTAFMRCHNP